MNSVYFPILSLGIRSRLVNRLQKAIQLQKKSQLASPLHLPTEPSCCIPLAQLLPHEPLTLASSLKIPLSRVKDNAQICYVSAIALKLAGQSSRKGLPIDIALEMKRCLEQTMALRDDDPLGNSLLDWVLQNVTVRVDSPGWIYLELTEQGVAEWLLVLAEQLHPSNLDQSTSRVANHTLSILEKAQKIRNSTDKFPVLYSHARCYSLLRSATKESIITQNKAGFELKDATSDLFKPQQPFKPRHPAEQHLISQFMTILDSTAQLNKATPALLWKSAQALSHSFEEFHKGCRIWGEIMQDEPQLARRRLGLVLITQKILRSLLEVLEIEAPLEL